MIELINVSKYYPTDFGRHYVFQDVSLVLPLDKSVGVLGPNGAGKSTFLRLLGGADMPSEGQILKTGKISPPMGLTPGLQASLTGVENARFAGRIHGMTRDAINDMIDYVRELSGIGKFFDMPVGTYSAGMKQRVAFAVNMSMNFDYYLFDEISAGGDKEFRKITRALVQERLETAKFIIASHRFDELLDICDSGILIQDGELTFFEDIKDALKAYGEDDEKIGQKAERSKKRRSREEEEGTESLEAGEDREAKRELRRQRRLQKDGVAGEEAPAEAQPGSEAIPGTMAVGEEGEKPGGAVDIEDRPEKRRHRKAAKLQALELQAAAQEAAPIEQAIAAAVAGADVMPAEDDASAKDTRRRTRRERRARQGQEPDAAESGQSAAAIETPAAVSQVAPQAVETEAAAVPPDEVKSQRMLRRQERLKARHNADISPVDTPRDEERAEIAGVGIALPSAAAGETPPAAVNASVPQADNRPGGGALQRAVFRQERAGTKAARAFRLLQQHLDERSAGTTATDTIRAALVTAAQEIAAQEASHARRILDGEIASPPAGASEAVKPRLAAHRREPQGAANHDI